MSGSNRDMYILGKIVNYCMEANETITRFGDSIEILRKDVIYKNAAAMCVLQIGELVGHLSEDFIFIYPKMPLKRLFSDTA